MHYACMCFNFLVQYRYPDQVAEDVLALISNFKNLKVQDPRKFGMIVMCGYLKLTTIK